MADYYISKVKYNDEHTRIVAALVHPSVNGNVGEGIRKSRTDIVTSINGGKAYKTIIWRDGQWRLGADVHVVRMGSGSYIRTDGNSIEADNLGDLPEL